MLQVAGTIALSSAALLVPMSAAAQTLGKVLSLFNIFVGMMLAFSLVVYAVGFVIWVTRLGTWPTYRTEGIKITEWSVAMLFTLFLLLLVVQFFRDHPARGAAIVALIVIIGVAWLVINQATHKEKKEEKKP